MNQTRKSKKVKMTFIKFITAALYLVVGSITVSGCADDDGISGDCPQPTVDGGIYELSGSCRVSAEEEHIRLEGVTVTSDQKIEIWVKASDISGENGIKITVDDTNISYENLDDTSGTNMFEEAHGGLNATTVCFDLHFEESPVHAISWKGTECDSKKEGEDNIGKTIWNKEPDDAVTGNDIEGNSKYLYRITNASVSTIMTTEPIFEE